jgi:hypothetical protein
MSNTQQNSIFPSVPRTSNAIEKDGTFNVLWELFFGELSQALQSNFNNEGILFPSLSSNDINTIASFYTPFIGGTYNNLLLSLPDISGQTVFDSTNRVPKQFIIKYDASVPPIVTSTRWWTFTLT